MVYPSNSNQSKSQTPNPQTQEKPAEVRAQPMFDEPVKTVKRSAIRRAMTSIVKEDIPNFLKFNVYPTGKKLLYDLIISEAGQLLHISDNQIRNFASYINYHDVYQNRQVKAQSPAFNHQYTYEDAIFNNCGQAQELLDRLYELLDRYGQVRVADYYQLIGRSSQYTDNGYGWTDLRLAKPRPVSGGWIIDFPTPIPL